MAAKWRFNLQRMPRSELLPYKWLNHLIEYKIRQHLSMKYWNKYEITSDWVSIYYSVSTWLSEFRNRPNSWITKITYYPSPFKKERVSIFHKLAITFILWVKVDACHKILNHTFSSTLCFFLLPYPVRASLETRFKTDSILRLLFKLQVRTIPHLNTLTSTLFCWRR